MDPLQVSRQRPGLVTRAGKRGRGMPTQAGFNPHDLLNQTIGGYQLREVLGTGNALVYRAYDKGKNEYVALKLVSWPGAQVDETTLRRFKREIDLLRKRHHAAIIDIYD